MNGNRDNRRKRRNVEYNCQNCYEEDDMEMVQCDRCDKWSHYRCAGVGKEIVNFVWLCNKCKKEIGSGVDPTELFMQPIFGISHKEDNSKHAAKHEDMYMQNPVTVSEKLKSFEKKYEAVLGEVAELRLELKFTKDEVSHTKNEMAKLEKENDELKLQRIVKAQEIQEIKSEICDLKKEMELKGCVASAAKITGAKEADFRRAGNTSDKVLPRTVFQKLPCDSIPELNEVKEDLVRDLDAVNYMEKRLGSIGGSDAKACLTSIFNRLFTRNLQGDMSLTGKRTEKNVTLQDYTIIMDVINNAVRKTHANYKDKDGEPLITKILAGK